MSTDKECSFEYLTKALGLVRLEVPGHTVAGLMLGALATGASLQSSGFIRSCTQLLNAEHVPTGGEVASLTALASRLSQALAQEGADLLCFPGTDYPAARRLEALSELSHGLLLGFGLSSQSQPSWGMDPELLSFSGNLSEFCKVDTQGALQEDDLQELLSYIADELRALHRRSTAQ